MSGRHDNYRWTLLQLEKLITRLDNSDTQLKRRNARRAAHKLIRKLRTCIDNEYPAWSQAQRDKESGIFCKACRTPHRNADLYAWHLRTHHGSLLRIGLQPSTDKRKPEPQSVITCPCGKQCKGHRGFAAHLRALHKKGKLAQHLSAGAMKMRTRNMKGNE